MIDIYEQKLQEHSQDFSSFLYTVFHDLKASLRAISNLSDWLETDLENCLPLENERQLKLLRQRAKGMVTMLTSLQSYLCIEQTEASVETIDVKQLLAEIINTFDSSFSLRIKIDPQMPTLTTKWMLLSQVFTNLISHAVKHCRYPESYIQISVQEQPQFYEFAVAYHQPSIDLEKRYPIATLIETVESDGMIGVDLAIARKIVEAEAGTIQEKSNPESGMTIAFTWPKSYVLEQL
jgi:light-regulated signal transduction histidine kinase (bacteriophytochrome)